MHRIKTSLTALARDQATRKSASRWCILFAIASILIAFATIRLAIYTARDEIAVMRLVGPPTAYIRGPFVVAGIITASSPRCHRASSSLWPATWYAGAEDFRHWLGGFNLGGYYGSHFAFIFLIHSRSRASCSARPLPCSLSANISRSSSYGKRGSQIHFRPRRRDERRRQRHRHGSVGLSCSKRATR